MKTNNYNEKSSTRGISLLYSIIKQQVLRELQEEKEKEYDKHLNELIHKYTDQEFKGKIFGG